MNVTIYVLSHFCQLMKQIFHRDNPLNFSSRQSSGQIRPSEIQPIPLQIKTLRKVEKVN